MSAEGCFCGLPKAQGLPGPSHRSSDFPQGCRGRTGGGAEPEALELQPQATGGFPGDQWARAPTPFSLQGKAFPDPLLGALVRCHHLALPLGLAWSSASCLASVPVFLPHL